MPSVPIGRPIAVGGVVEQLQAAVRLHLVAIENYEGQSAHFQRWGYSKLAAKSRDEAKGERHHLRAAMGRLEFYDEQPELGHDSPSWPRHDYEGILAANLDLERAAANVERAGVLACRDVGDEQSALVFADLLHGSEESIAEIEAAQRILEQIGLDNYLANQV